MQLSDTERQCLTTILAQYDQHPEVQRMREFIQHGDVTTYQHCKHSQPAILPYSFLLRIVMRR